MNNPQIQIQQAIDQGKIGGSWLVTGGYEYEKKHFVKEVCSKLLNKNLMVFDGYSPDVKWIECGLTDEAKKEIQKTILAGKALDTEKEFSKKREITVDEIRAGIQFLSLKGVENQWRILIINPADKMNESASNALLKILEEPPQKAVIFLICHNLGQLLPTIKSRCRKVVIPPVSDQELKQKITEAYPNITRVDDVVSLSKGMWGLAKEICDNGGLELYDKIQSFYQPAMQISASEVSELASSLNLKTYPLAQLFLLDEIAQKAQFYALTQPFVAEDWINLYQEASILFADVDRIYLDKKQVLQTVIFKIGTMLND